TRKPTRCNGWASPNPPRQPRMNDPIRLAVLLSGHGLTLQNLLDRIADGRLRAQVVLVISNRSDAFGLERAAKAGIPSLVIPRKSCATADEFCRRVFDPCREAKVDLVCLAGFLQLLPIPEDYRNRVMNMHPALIPSFCGKGFYGERV